MRWLLFLLLTQANAADLVLEIKAKDSQGVVTHEGTVTVPAKVVIPPPVVCPGDPSCPPPVCPGDPSCQPPPPPPPPTGSVQFMNMVDGQGPNWLYANPGLWHTWKNPVGDWIDAEGVTQGPKAYVVHPLRSANDFKGWISIDVTAIAKRPLNRGYLIAAKRLPVGSWGVKFASKEAPAPLNNHGPRLNVVTDQGSFVLPSLIDTYVDKSSGTDLSRRDFFSAVDKEMGNNYANIILRFDMTQAPGVVQSATLEMYQIALYGHHDLLVYELDLPELLTDIGTQHPEWVEAGSGTPIDQWPCSFTTESLKAWYTNGYVVGTAGAEVVRWPGYPCDVLKAKFANIPGGASANNASLFMFEPNAAKRKPWQGATPYEAPQDLYVRYLVRPGFTLKDCMTLPMKMPGMHGKWDAGRDGWMPIDWRFDNVLGHGFAFAIDHGFYSPANDAFGLVFYLYSAGPPGSRLDGVTTGGTVLFDRPVSIRPGEVYTIEYRMKMNTRDPVFQNHLPNGTFTLWVDGVRVIDRNDIHWRGHDAANIWMIVTQFFHGGNGNPRCTMDYETAGLSFSAQYMGPYQKVRP
jgi:hypothetical protein